jgi:hypothetical protein
MHVMWHTSRRRIHACAAVSWTLLGQETAVAVCVCVCLCLCVRLCVYAFMYIVHTLDRYGTGGFCG